MKKLLIFILFITSNVLAQEYQDDLNQKLIRPEGFRWDSVLINNVPYSGRIIKVDYTKSLFSFVKLGESQTIMVSFNSKE